MKPQPRLALAFFLILMGFWYLAIELFPRVSALAYGEQTWPIQIIGVGIVLAALGLLCWTSGLMIPAASIGGIGGLLYWQNITGRWESWAYAWALIIIFVGVGIGLTGIMERKRSIILGAGWTIFIGMLLFIVFGAFLGGSDLIQKYWPVVIILLGGLFLVKGFLKRSA